MTIKSPKGRFEPNSFQKNRTVLTIQGYGEVFLVTHGKIERKVGYETNPDGTYSVNGVEEPGELDVTFQFASKEVADAFEQLFGLCVYAEDGSGIDPSHSRLAQLRYGRVHRGEGGDFNSGRDLPDKTFQLKGFKVVGFNIPDGDIGAKDQCIAEAKILWDSIKPDPANALN